MKKKLSAAIAISLVILSASPVFGGDFVMSFMRKGASSQYKSYAAQNVMDAVSPDYFLIMPNGSLAINNLDTSFVDLMHKQNARVTPFISNYQNRELAVAALMNRAGLAAEIADAIFKYDLDGIAVVFSSLTENERESFSSFIRDIKDRVGDKAVSVAVPANPEDPKRGLYDQYDYESLGKAADNLIVMSFDESYVQETPGPISSYDFIKSALSAATELAPKEKIILGTSFYGRYWSANKNEAGKLISHADIEKILRDFPSEVKFDAASGNYCANVTVNGSGVKIMGDVPLAPGEYSIWYEAAESLSGRKELVDEFGVKGMAFWSLGQDNSSAWNASEAETAPVSKSLDEKIYEPELEVVFGEILDPNEADEVSERIMRSWRSTEEDGKQTETITFEIIDEEAAADVINNEQPQTLPGNLPAGNTNSGVSPLPGNAPQSAAPLPGNTPQNASPLPGNAPQGANFYNDNNKNNLAPTQNNRNFVPETGYDPAYGSNYIPNENTSNNLNNNNFNNNNFNNSRSPSARPAPSVTSIPAPVPSANPSPAAPNGFSEAEVEAMEAFSPGNDAAPDGTFESYTPPANAETLPGGVNNGNDNGTSPQTLPGAIGNDNGNAPQTLPGTIGNDNGNGNGAQTLPGTLNTEENNLEENEDYVPSQDKNLLQPLPGIWPYQDKNSLEGPSSQDKNSLQPLPGNVPGNETLPGTPSQNEDIQTLPGTPGFQRPNPLLAPFRGLFENDSNNDGQTDPENSDRENSSPGNSGSGTSPRALPGDVTPIPTNDREYTPSDNGDDSRSFSRPIIEDDEPTEINLEAAREYIFFNNWMSEEDYFSDPYVTRSQALKAVVKMANIDESAVDQYAESYRDTKNHPDRDYIEAARARDIIAVAGDYLNPDENIKKSELIAILESAFEVPEVAASFNFSRVNDVARSESESAYSAINKFYAAGVIKVDENNNFHPNDLLTKEEFAHIIYNMKDYQAKSFDGYNFSGKVILDRIFSSSR